MAINPLRKILWKTGYDFHKHRPEPDHLVWLSKAHIETVLDIGANIGQFAEDIRAALPLAHIYSFEPLKDCYDTLVAARKDDTRFTALPYALGEKNEETIIHRSSSSPSSSLRTMSQKHKDLYPHTKGSTDEKILVRRLDDVSELKGDIKKEILVKIDTQGYEDKVIAGGTEFIKKAKVLIIETAYVSLYEGQPLFADIYKQVTVLGFSYKGALHQKFDSNGGVLYEDSLFVR
jgi:FkbM family methyltransferase